MFFFFFLFKYVAFEWIRKGVAEEYAKVSVKVSQRVSVKVSIKVSRKGAH